MSLKMTLRRALASDTLMRSIVNSSFPFSSVFETMRGMYLLTADLEWNGIESAAEEADDIFSLNNNS